MSATNICAATGYSNSAEALGALAPTLGACGISCRADGIPGDTEFKNAEFECHYAVDAVAIGNVLVRDGKSGNGLAFYPVGQVTLVVIEDADAAIEAGLIEVAEWQVSLK